MSDAPNFFRFFQASSADAPHAFAFHTSIADSNEHIWPRTKTEIKGYCSEGELFGIVKDNSGEFVGLCYSHLDESTNEWEIGGLTVTDEFQKLHLGSFLVRFALARTITTGDPWKYGQRIVAHVHSENDAPRNLLKRIHFEYLRTIEVSADEAPPSMKRNPNGKLTGDEFEFKKSSVRFLYNWFVKEFNGLLADGKTMARFDCGEHGIGSVVEDLRTLAEENSER
jgi:ribosomal protein S18 acetylase RimI-like enzyme